MHRCFSYDVCQILVKGVKVPHNLRFHEYLFFALGSAIFDKPITDEPLIDKSVYPPYWNNHFKL